MQGEYLSALLSEEDIGNDGAIDLIVAPCGAGKTSFALDVVASICGGPQKTVYLIDTIAGKDQLLQNPKCQCYNREWRENDYPENLTTDGKVTVMTYAFFGTLCKHFPNWYEGLLDTIICDEIHKLFEMRLWDISKKIPIQESIYDIAWEAILKASYFWQVQSVVAMTATPQLLYQSFTTKEDRDWADASFVSPQILRVVPIPGVPRHYEQENTYYYKNLTMLCNKIPADKKGIIYMSRISMMEKYRQLLEKRGIRAVSIWSPNNPNWWMDKQQHEVRNYIIENAAVPENVDVLLINKSCETSISIKSNIDYMIVHSSQRDVQTQAIGRYRNDLETLYLYDPEEWDDIELPEKMLNVPLFKEDITKYIEEQNIRDEKGRIIKQPTFIEYLRYSGYTVNQKKVKGGKRYHIITEENNSTQNQNIIY